MTDNIWSGNIYTYEWYIYIHIYILLLNFSFLFIEWKISLWFKNAIDYKYTTVWKRFSFELFFAAKENNWQSFSLEIEGWRNYRKNSIIGWNMWWPEEKCVFCKKSQNLFSNTNYIKRLENYHFSIWFGSNQKFWWKFYYGSYSLKAKKWLQIRNKQKYNDK